MVFTIIMTLRQAMAILLSCYIYGHVITVFGFVGIFVVFLAMFLNIYWGFKFRQTKKKEKESTKVEANTV